MSRTRPKQSLLIKDIRSAFIVIGEVAVMDRNDNNAQSDKFKEAARALECDDDEGRFKDRLRKLVKHKPVEKPE